jgi:antitoxin VapB
MGIFIKNPEVERKARALAARQGKSLTAVINEALEAAMARETEPADRRRPTLAEMHAATERFRKAVGLDRRKVNATRQDFDALWDGAAPDQRE